MLQKLIASETYAYLKYFFQVNLKEHPGPLGIINSNSGRPGQILSAEARNRKTMNDFFPELAPGAQMG